MLKRIRSLVSNSNFISIYDNALSKKECDFLIDYFEKDPDVYPGIVLNYGKPEVDKRAKIDTEKTHDLFNSSIFSCTVRNALNRCLLKYGTRYPSLKLTNTSSAYQYFNIQKFDGEEQGYKVWHTEHGPGVMSHRMLVWMFYLNDAKSGTEFMHHPNVRAKMGRCVIWPAGWPYLHKGIIPNRGVKYILTGWINYHEE